MTDLAIQRAAAAFVKASTPDPFVDSWAQASAAAEESKRHLRILLQGICPAGVRYGGVQVVGERVVHLFTDAAISGSTFSVRPDDLGVARIAAELRVVRRRFEHGQLPPVVLP